MASEIEAAAERLVNSGGDDWDSTDYWNSSQRDQDAEAVGEWVLSRLAADRAEREERARPIDAEWLESIGGGWSHEHQGATLRAWQTKNFSTGWGWSLRPNNAPTERVFTLRNRGEWLDLLRVLKGGAE